MTNFVLISALLIGASPANAWRAFRGSGDSVSLAENLPLKWSATDNLGWRVPLPGYGQSSPVVVNNKVFVTTMQGEIKNRPTVLCFNLATGKTHWQKEFKSTQNVMASDYVTRSSPTPAVDSKGIYAFFESGDLFALDHDGQQLWHRSLVKDFGKFKGNHGVGNSIAQTSKSVIVLVTHDGPSYLTAIDKKTGKDIWKTDYAAEAKVGWNSPIVTQDESTIVVSANGTVEAFDAATGKRKWYIEEVEGNTVASATVAGELVVIGSSAPRQNFAIKPDGQGNVAETHVAWRAEKATSSFGSPLIFQGRVYFVNRTGVAFCCNLSDGKELWTHRLGESCWASPIGAGDRIYFFTKAGKTVVMSADGKPKTLAENDLPTKDRVYGVAVVDNAFVVRHGTELIKIKSN